MTNTSLKAPPDKWDEKKLKFFNIEHQFNIKDMAKGLNETDILYWFGLEKKQFDNLSDYDKQFFTVNYRKGRVEGLQKSVENLFQQQKLKGGAPACLAHLTRFAEAWPVNKDDDEGGGKVLNFRVDLGG